MNIYLVTLDYFTYDAYDGHVVLADTEAEAIALCPWGDAEICGVAKVSPVATLIGKATDDAYLFAGASSPKIFLSSYNAG